MQGGEPQQVSSTGEFGNQSSMNFLNMSQYFIRDVTDDVTGWDKCNIHFLTLLALPGKAAISN